MNIGINDNGDLPFSEFKITGRSWMDAAVAGAGNSSDAFDVRRGVSRFSNRTRSFMLMAQGVVNPFALILPGEW